MLAVNRGKSGAKFGKDHWRVTIPFYIVEKARELHENGMPRKEILRIVEDLARHPVSLNTMQDWLYYQTRIYG
jgi:hypothetical protein